MLGRVLLLFGLLTALFVRLGVQDAVHLPAALAVLLIVLALVRSGAVPSAASPSPSPSPSSRASSASAVRIPLPDTRKAQRVLVTVGTTNFDVLIGEVLRSKCGIVVALQSRLRLAALTVQLGATTEFEEEDVMRRLGELVGPDVQLKVFKLKQGGLDAEIDEADLVLGHAGAGTLLDVCRRRRPFIVVVNTALMDNHQSEMAEAMAAADHCMAVDVAGVAALIRDELFAREHGFLPLPPPATASLVASIKQAFA